MREKYVTIPYDKYIRLIARMDGHETPQKRKNTGLMEEAAGFKETLMKQHPLRQRGHGFKPPPHPPPGQRIKQKQLEALKSDAPTNINTKWITLKWS
jgi:hypothetical protein